MHASGAKILMYHGVGDSSFSEQAFEAQLRYLARYFNPISLGEILDRRDDPKAVALTFDDGLRNNATIAAPLLLNHNIPATFFVCPGLIDKGQWVWTHEVRQRLTRLSPDHLQNLERSFDRPPMGIEAMVDWMKSLPHAKRKEIEQVIRRETPDFQPLPQERMEFDLMNWNELRALDPNLITVGAHTLTHAILTRTQPEEMEEEIVGCRKRLEEGLQRKIEYFCYPNGEGEEAAGKLVAQTYRAAVTAEPRLLSPQDPLEALPRIPGGDNLALLAWRFHTPGA